MGPRPRCQSLSPGRLLQAHLGTGVGLGGGPRPCVAPCLMSGVGPIMSQNVAELKNPLHTIKCLSDWFKISIVHFLHGGGNKTSPLTLISDTIHDFMGLLPQ